jgi:hypothetical protein
MKNLINRLPDCIEDEYNQSLKRKKPGRPSFTEDEKLLYSKKKRDRINKRMKHEKNIV